MIKTLRITSIVAAILAAIFLISLVLFGNGSNEQVEQFLNSESVVEKFNKAEKSEVKRGRDRTSPLVTQAKEFAKYLNPPPAPKPPSPPVVHKPSIQPPRPAVSSAKFTLIGTSYYASQPQRSLAFINEPGKGLRWIRQSSSVGHLIIEHIKDGLVVVRDGQRTFELSVPERPQRSLIEGAEPSAVLGQTVPGSTATISSPALPSAEEISLIAEALRSIQASAESSDADQKEMEKIMADLESMRISAGEVERLKDLPEELTPASSDASRGGGTADPNQTRGRKVARPARPRKSTLPSMR